MLQSELDGGFVIQLVRKSFIVKVKNIVINERGYIMVCVDISHNMAIKASLIEAINMSDEMVDVRMTIVSSLEHD